VSGDAQRTLPQSSEIHTAKARDRMGAFFASENQSCRTDGREISGDSGLFGPLCDSNVRLNLTSFQLLHSQKSIIRTVWPMKSEYFGACHA